MYNLQEAYLGVYYDLNEVTGRGRIDPLSNYPGYGEFEHLSRTPEAAGLAMSPIKRAEGRVKTLRQRNNPKDTKRANQITSRFINPTYRGLDRAISTQRQDRIRRLTQNEETQLDLYDLIFDYLLDEGYADTEEAATVIMANMSEDWIDDIYEEVLDEAHQIMSVNRDGKEIYKVRRSQLDRPSNELSSHKKNRRNQLIRARRNADRRGDDSPARERAFDRFVSGTDTPFNRIRTSNIKKLNAPTDPDKYGDNDPYHTVKTDYRARRRRASGR